MSDPRACQAECVFVCVCVRERERSILSRPRLAIYRHLLLARQDRFIALQAGSFVDSDVCLFGIQRSYDLALDVPHWLLGECRAMSSVAVRTYQLSRRSGRLVHELSKWKPTLIIAHYAQDGWRIAPTAKALQVPLVVTCHGSDVLCRNKYASKLGWSGRQLRRNWDRLAEAVDLFLPVSQFVGRALEQRGVPREKILVHYLGIPIPSTLGQSCRRPKRQFLFVGRLEKNKGCVDLLKAFNNLKSSMPGIRLKIVGDGPERPSLQSYAQTLGLSSDEVNFTGFLDSLGVAAALDESTALCVPSIETDSGISEGLGLVALEAQVREVPVIAYRTGGLPEVVHDGVGGVLVSAGDVVSLANVMKALLREPDWCREMGRRGMRFVKDRFDSHVQTRALERQLLQRFAPGHVAGGGW
jgi:colanic acid/amylovoran biosynthesis glycosyltransferase